MASPTIQVLLDDGTGSFPFDISRYVLAGDGLQITRGRDDWQGAVTAGELTLTLNNSDGRFSPGSTILATPSPIKVDQQIRVVEIGLGFGVGGFGLGGFGGTLTRFTGYVKSWPVTWPAVVSTFSTVQLTATDAQARAERRTLRSMLEEEILLRSPSAYYTLGEAEGSTSAGDTSGTQATPLVLAGSGTALTFGTGIGPGVDGLTAVQFFGGQFLSSTGAEVAQNGPAILAPDVYAVGVEFATTTTPSLLGVVLAYSNGWTLGIDPGGHLQGQLFTDLITSSRVVNDGLTHQAVVTSDGTTMTLYLDGVSVGTRAHSSGLLGRAYSSVGGAIAGTAFTGTISHFATWPALSAGDVAAIYAAGVGGAESGAARIARLAAYAGTSVGSLDASLTTVPAQATSGQSAQDAIQAVADAEMGLIFVNGSGGLEFHNRAHVSGKTTPDLLLDAQNVTADVTPVLDDQRIVNYVETTAAGTGSTSLAHSQASETAHGRYPTSETYLVATDREALDRANWIITKQAEPSTRYGTLTINLYKMPADQASNVVATVGLDCWLRVTSLGPQNPGGTVADVVVQGFQESGENEAWSLACNVVARSMYDALILDDPTYGALDSQSILN